MVSRTSTSQEPEPVGDRVLTVYVDGSGRHGPRKGGIGILFAWSDEAGHERTDPHALPATDGATNNQMELEAPTQALQIALRGRTPFDLRQFEKVVIISDSRYVTENLRFALFVWPKTGWRTKEGRAVLNERDWKALTKLMQRLYAKHRIRVSLEWEPGKVSPNAKVVDKLAKQSSAGASFGRSRPVNVRRKLTSAKAQIGSVVVAGQRLRIRIVQAQHLSKTETRYRYEVADPASLYNGSVDFVESAQVLAPGHTYDVRMNADQATRASTRSSPRSKRTSPRTRTPCGRLATRPARPRSRRSSRARHPSRSALRAPRDGWPRSSRQGG